ncbi:type II/IV secretion system protein [Sporolactobacillus sp. THM7-7]|nr:type II/IV secretion system protein [Sporolactobacillus sp. THM7-7]
MKEGVSLNNVTNDVEERSRALLEDAHSVGASDIHFIPREDDTLIELRVHGYLYQLAILSRDLAQRIINHFKFLSGMDIGEKRLPQSGAMLALMNQDSVSLRMSTLPTPNRESLVIRLLPQRHDFSIADLSVFDEATERLSALLNYDNGLILISGPTGSGKTTTLYTLLSALQRRYNARIITLEDPIEKKNDAFVQMEVKEKANFTYAEGFKAILRHDPDIIMIGEIRDAETAKVAIRASLTGHLVLSTVHASSAAGTIQRLMELGISRFDLKETLASVIAERLVSIQCPTCGSVCRPDCENRHHPKRTAVFEILAGMPLHNILSSRIPGVRPDYKTIEDYLREGIAKGWIPKASSKGRDESRDSKKLD